MLMCIAVYSQTVEIPDKNFEQALINLEIDSDGELNGLLLKSDAVQVTSLDVSNEKIKDLTGIEAFTSLVYLDCSDNELSGLDVTQNIALINLFCSINDIAKGENSIAYIDWFD